MTSNGEYIKALLTEIAACLCNQITEDGRPKPCFCGVVPGATVAPDFMPDCFGGEGPIDGMAWVRLINAYPSFQPGVVVENPAESWVAGLGFDVEVGIVRSIPIPEEGLDEAEAATAVTGQMDDMLTIRRAIMCCVGLERADYLLNQYAPVGPLGGIVGGAFTVMVHRP